MVENILFNLYITSIIYIITNETASRATRVRISAQETTPGHVFSSADFTASIT